MEQRYQLKLSEELVDVEWDNFLKSIPSVEYEQSSQWARVKSTQGWNTLRITVTTQGDIAGGAQILMRLFPLIGGMGFISKGPVFSDNSAELTQFLLEGLFTVAKKNHIRYLMIQPSHTGQDITPFLIQNKFTKCSLFHLTSATTKINLSHDIEDIFNNISKRNRGYIKKNKMVTIREGTINDIPIFFKLMLETCNRQGVPPNPPHEKIIQSMWIVLAPNENIKLFIAEHTNQAIAGMLAIIFGDTFVDYKIGWSGKHSILRPNLILHWETIKWAKKMGYRFYDFSGITRQTAENIVNGQHYTNDLDGSTLFKLKFGGEVLLLPEGYELIVNPFLRWIYYKFSKFESCKKSSRTLLQRFRTYNKRPFGEEIHDNINNDE